MTFKLAERLRPVLRFRRIGFEALAVGTGQALAAVGSVIGVRVLTEAMPPREYGELALAMTIGTLGLQVFLAPLATSAMRFFSPASEAGDLRGFLGAARKLIVQAVLLVGLIAVAGILVLAAASKAVWIPLTIAAFVYTVFAGTNSVLDGLQNAARHRVVVATHGGLLTWLRFLLAVALMQLAASASSAVAMAGYALASALVFTSQMFFFRRTISRSPDAAGPAGDVARWRTAMLTYGLPFATWGVFSWAQSASDRWALGAFAGATEVGYYAVVYQLGYYPILMASTLLSTVAAPILYQRAGDATDPARVQHAVKLNVRMAGLTVILTVVAFGVTQLAHPLIGRLLLASEYRGLTHLLPWMVVAGGLFATGQAMALFFMITNRSSDLTAPKIGTAVIGVALNMAAARLYGVTGVIAAVIFTALVYCLWMMIIALRTYRGAPAS